MDIRPLTAVAAALLAFGSGCVTADAKKTGSKKPDVTQPGVLPPPQETTRAAPVAGPGGVVQASASVPAPVAAAPPAAPSVSMPSLSKLTAKMERKLIATEMAVGWQPRVAYLPDPARSGRMSPGVAGQMFLFGGPKLEFVQADGTLTVDLVDETPRPAGQPAATPERWQFDAATLRNLQTRDETFGKSYVLFLPWPAYKPDITKVRISARYDPESGHPLFATPSTITIDTSAPFGAPVWSDQGTTTGTKPTASAPPVPGPAAMTGIGGMPLMPQQPAGGQPPIAFTLPSR